MSFRLISQVALLFLNSTCNLQDRNSHLFESEKIENNK